MTAAPSTVRTARVGVTGHVDVPEETVDWIRRQLTVRLRDLSSPGWRGITCLARGADQIFAHVVLALHGRLQVVLPAEDYEREVVDEANRETFRKLLAQAEQVRTLPLPKSDRDAYFAASATMLDDCDVLIAIWNGAPSRQRGDTADVVRAAREKQIPVTVIWPPGVERTDPAPVTAPPPVTPAAAPDRG